MIRRSARNNAEYEDINITKLITTVQGLSQEYKRMQPEEFTRDKFNETLKILAIVTGQGQRQSRRLEEAEVMQRIIRKERADFPDAEKAFKVINSFIMFVYCLDNIDRIISAEGNAIRLIGDRDVQRYSEAT